MRRIGEAVRRGVRYHHRPGAYALLPLGGALLVAAKTAPRPDFLLPGGGVDPGEGVLQALHREVREETGWSIARPRRLGAFRRFVWMDDYDMWGEKVCHVFVAHPVRPLGPPSEPDHVGAWIPLADAPWLLSVEGERAFAARLAG